MTSIEIFVDAKDIAWKLLTNDVGEKLNFDIVPPNSSENNILCKFETLLVIFMEILLNIMLINDNAHIKTIPKNNLNKGIDDICELITKTGYFVCVEKYDLEYMRENNMKTDFDVICENRYCRIIFDDTYEIKINGLKNNDNCTKLNSLYAIMTINDTMYEITFDKI